jgi:hypothetical protein
MELYRKFIILAIVLLTFYLLFRLHSYRIQLLKQAEVVDKKNDFEGFTSKMPQNTQNNQLMMNQYCVRASFHSAYNQTSKMIDLELLAKVLKSGVRFLDFEIYNILDPKTNTPFAGVGYCSELNPSNLTVQISNTFSDPNIQFVNVLNSIVQNKPPQITDPLFIHLRIKTTVPAIYSQIATAIQFAFPNVLFSGKLDINHTSLANLQNKIIIVVDKTNSVPDYMKYADCSQYRNIPNCQSLTKFINLESGTPDFNYLPQSMISCINPSASCMNPTTVNLSKDNKTCTVGINPSIEPTWSIAVPNPIDAKNPTICPFITKYAIQIVPFRYDLDDANLATYESVFGTNGFVSLANALLALKNCT